MRSRRFNSSKHEIRPSYLLIYLFACVILSFVWQTFDESTPFTSFCTHFKCTVCFHSHFPNFSLFLIPSFNKVEKKWFVYVFKCQFFISYCRLFFVNLFFFLFVQIFFVPLCTSYPKNVHVKECFVGIYGKVQQCI